MPILLFTISYFLSNVLILNLLPFFRKFFIDKPNFRSSHFEAKATGGGIIIVLITFVASLLSIKFNRINNIEFIPILTLPLSLISFLDDKFNLAKSVRFLSQAIVAFLILKYSINYSFISGLNNNLILIFLLLIGCIYIINAFNFFDGLDGILSSSFSIILLTIGLYNLDSVSFVWAMLGAVIGFIYWNWHPSKIFMGDVGSTTFGAIYVGLILNSSSLYLSFVFISLSFPILCDTTITLIRRILAGQKFLSPHKSHLYQRLNRGGLSHNQVSIIYLVGVISMAISSLFGFFAIILTSFIEFLIGIWLNNRIAISFTDSQ